MKKSKVINTLGHGTLPQSLMPLFAFLAIRFPPPIHTSIVSVR